MKTNNNNSISSKIHSAGAYSTVSCLLKYIEINCIVEFFVSLWGVIKNLEREIVVGVGAVFSIFGRFVGGEINSMSASFTLFIISSIWLT